MDKNKNTKMKSYNNILNNIEIYYEMISVLDEMKNTLIELQSCVMEIAARPIKSEGSSKKVPFIKWIDICINESRYTRFDSKDSGIKYMQSSTSIVESYKKLNKLLEKTHVGKSISKMDKSILTNMGSLVHILDIDTVHIYDLEHYIGGKACILSTINLLYSECIDTKVTTIHRYISETISLVKENIEHDG